jgi:hypothetical protein
VEYRSQKNSIRFGKLGINASDFELSNSGSSNGIPVANRKENAHFVDFKDENETIVVRLEKRDLNNY